ncbi:hypothetical protein Drorol1_Dr00012363 [Drosera rotundifolia]
MILIDGIETVVIVEKGEAEKRVTTRGKDADREEEEGEDDVVVVVERKEERVRERVWEEEGEESKMGERVRERWSERVVVVEQRIQKYDNHRTDPVQVWSCNASPEFQAIIC